MTKEGDRKACSGPFACRGSATRHINIKLASGPACLSILEAPPHADLCLVACAWQAAISRHCTDACMQRCHQHECEGKLQTQLLCLSAPYGTRVRLPRSSDTKILLMAPNFSTLSLGVFNAASSMRAPLRASITDILRENGVLEHSVNSQKESLLQHSARRASAHDSATSCSASTPSACCF